MGKGTSRAWYKNSPLNGSRKTPQTQSRIDGPKELSPFKATCVLFLLNQQRAP